jgi:hypothetical protein
VVALSPPQDKVGYRVTLAMLRSKAGNHDTALAEAEALDTELPRETPWVAYYGLAKVCADALRAAAKDGGEKRGAYSDRAAAAALRLLDKARNAAGETEWKKHGLEAAWDFRVLAGREAYEQWLKGMPAANKP